MACWVLTRRYVLCVVCDDRWVVGCCGVLVLLRFVLVQTELCASTMKLCGQPAATSNFTISAQPEVRQAM